MCCLKIYSCYIDASDIKHLDCRYYANFSIRYNQKRYIGTPLIKHNNVHNISSCALQCVVNKVCRFFNYNKDNSKCELMYSDQYLYYDETKLETANNWEFAAALFHRRYVSIFISISFFVFHLLCFLLYKCPFVY